MANSFRRIPRAWWLAIPLLSILYFSGLTASGMLGPDEPRYASIGREMARSGAGLSPMLTKAGSSACASPRRAHVQPPSDGCTRVGFGA